MAAPKKYGDELRERATRMAVELRKDPATRAGAIQRIAQLERENRELKRANEILRTASAFFAAAELDRKLK
jgi:transposase